MRREFGSAYIRENCFVEGCDLLQRGKGKSKTTGKKIYDKFCNYHHRIKLGLPAFPDQLNIRLRLPNRKCISCGWDKAGCDRHRIDSNGGYIPENVLILCPNCHRLRHLGLLKLRGELDADNYT